MYKLENRLSPEDSNRFISEKINKDRPFMISRIGLGGESAVSALTLSNMNIPPHILGWFYTNAGFYGTNYFDRYSNIYSNACKTSDVHAYWHFDGFVEIENFLVSDNKTFIDPSSLESFRFECPWTKQLENRKILVISPFKKTIDSQILIKDKIWQNKDVLPDAEWITYKSVQSIGGKGPHKDWYESYDIMCEDISKIDFDIALLGCGSYGLPLCDFIRNILGRSAIYVGGGLQLYFGIKGKRWDSDIQITKSYNEYWVRPMEEEKPELANFVEGGCYW